MAVGNVERTENDQGCEDYVDQPHKQGTEPYESEPEQMEKIDEREQQENPKQNVERVQKDDRGDFHGPIVA